MTLTKYSLRALRSSKAPIFRRGEYWAFTQLLTGKRDLKSLYSHCSKSGVSVEELTVDRDRVRTYLVLMDARRQKGLCFPDMGGPSVAHMDGGRFVEGDASLRAELDALVKTLEP
jgi:hypothetical protein